MKNTSRVNNSIINSIVSVITQILLILISFIGRTFFIKILGADYLGVNGLFTNILSILSFAELGIGTAIIYSLYKPIDEKDEKKISAYMNLYKKAYTTIGCIVLISGILIMPLLQIFIKDFEQYRYMNIYIVYILFLINSAITYFYSYKRSLIIANQEKYIDSINRIICMILLNIFQIAILYITKNYILFLIIQIIFSIIENISITIIANKKYPFLNKNKKEKLKKEEIKTIKNNVKALIMHKIGSIVVSNTDNILISSFIGLNVIGIYSNYSMIITAIKTIINQIFTSITASVGNLNVKESVEKSQDIFLKITFINFWIVCVVSAILIVVMNDFITIWIGKDYLLEFPVLIVLVITFFLYEMRQTLFTYKNTYGLFYQDRYIPLIEALINFIVSIILVKYLGIIGIFLGTIISTLCTCFWTEPYFLYKVKFNKKLSEYMKVYLKYIFISIIIIIICIFVSFFINVKNIIFNIILKFLITFIISNVILLAIFKNTNQFNYFYTIIKNKLNKITNKKKEN